MKYKYTIIIKYSDGVQNIIECKSLPQLNEMLYEAFGIPYTVLPNYKNFSNGITYWRSRYTITIYREESCLSH